ncbi:DUF2934 domain-containing protein [Teichococcus oryzae]|uniref:DUF2934 domain-containing protein n=1 Tax=Teichococcus oryzae TaxID=1608942 RepID=A0A5B2TEH3_9PROT|nr:DUF2934 domain-containing protein [Pseudoroseomonas oryzae]KAA2212559.1 DUF2934 domain-containing protein [Pseudoroseomonas oryzae]
MTEEDQEKQLRERAYYLWLQAGQPEGQAAEFWEQAQAEEKAALQAEASPERPAAGDAVSSPAPTPSSAVEAPRKNSARKASASAETKKAAGKGNGPARKAKVPAKQQDAPPGEAPPRRKGGGKAGKTATS